MKKLKVYEKPTSRFLDVLFEGDVCVDAMSVSQTLVNNKPGSDGTGEGVDGFDAAFSRQEIWTDEY